MRVAELRVHHSRSPSATRRVAPEPYRYRQGSGAALCGLLCAAILAEFLPCLDDTEREQLHILLTELDERPRPPRALRHRIQRDRHGLDCSTHVLTASSGGWTPLVDAHGAPAPQVVGAVVALDGLGHSDRLAGIDIARRTLDFPGGTFEDLLGWLRMDGEIRLGSVHARGTRIWAFEVLGLDGDEQISDTDVTRAFRRRLREEHPDHGADAAGAADRLARLRTARAILMRPL